jgi:hypothetical protein
LSAAQSAHQSDIQPALIPLVLIESLNDPVCALLALLTGAAFANGVPNWGIIMLSTISAKSRLHSRAAAAITHLAAASPA